jgi:dTDP-4-dehydrorhamnose reductase
MTACAVVFGSGGQVGRELMMLASARNYSFEGFTQAGADITDLVAVERIIDKFHPSLVINCAAYTAVDKAERDVTRARAVNIDGARNIAVACSRANVPLLHLSTDYVFDGRKIGPYVETDLPAPLSVYGLTKWEGEQAVRSILSQHIVLRTSWVYSARGSNFLKTISRLAGEKEELRIVNDQFGCPTAAIDIAEAILAIFEKITSSKSPKGTYHFAGLECMSWYAFACEIAQQQSVFSGRLPRIIQISTEEFPTLAKRPQNSELDSSLFINSFGYIPANWRTRITESIGILMNSEDWKRS